MYGRLSVGKGFFGAFCSCWLVRPCIRPVGAAFHAPLAIMPFARLRSRSKARTRRCTAPAGSPDPAVLTGFVHQLFPGANVSRECLTRVTSGRCSRRTESPLLKSEARSRRSAFVKSFGRWQAYESPRGRNPRATVDAYGDFEFRLMSGVARPPSGSAGLDAERPLRCASARGWRPGAGPDGRLLASAIAMDARGSVTGGR
jgi:hypothetical protein